MYLALRKINHLAGALLISSALIFSPNSFANDRMMEYKNPGMMGQGMMGMCHLATSENVKMNITETSEGFTVTYSAKDKKEIFRLQKMAKIAKLSQELKEEESTDKK